MTTAKNEFSVSVESKYLKVSIKEPGYVTCSRKRCR